MECREIRYPGWIDLGRLEFGRVRAQPFFRGDSFEAASDPAVPPLEAGRLFGWDIRLSARAPLNSQLGLRLSGSNGQRFRDVHRPGVAAEAADGQHQHVRGDVLPHLQ
jgi:hypothetical protein